MRFVYNAATAIVFGLCVRLLFAYGKEWRFGKFWTPTPILEPGMPVTSIEGMLAVSGALPYLHLLGLATIIALVALPFIYSHWSAKRLEAFRREIAGIWLLPVEEREAALDRIVARHRKSRRY